MVTAGMLHDRTALITGTASGIGQAAALRFADEGARVVVVDRDRDGGRATAQRILTNGGLAISVHADVSRPRDAEDAVGKAVGEYGGLDILVNNAAVELVASLEQTSTDDWEHVLANNLRSVFLCSKYAVPYLRSEGRGAVVNIASVNGLLGIPEHAAYNAAKGGVISLTRQLAVDYGPSGVRVNCICPSTTLTPMVMRSLPARDRDRRLRELESRHPLNRLGRPEEIANAILFLASDEASWITGVVLPVDGGYSCQ